MKKNQSDPRLLADIRKYGKFNPNACYQCGSCTIVCNLTNNSASFPRKIIQYSLMGLRPLLSSSLEPWLCYYCGDCSTTCPRQTEPGEAMKTIRCYLTAHYDWTGISSKIYKSKLWELSAITFVGLLVLLIALYYHLAYVGLELQDLTTEAMGMEHMFDKITDFTLIVFFLPFLILLSNGFRMYWLTMRKDNNFKIPFILYLTELKTLLFHWVAQTKFRECTDKNRWLKHVFLATGCFLMFFILIFFLKWLQTDNFYPLYHPQRWLGYLATIALLYGTIDILIGRIKKRDEIHKFSDMSDWMLPILLLLTTISGIAVHIFRYLEFSLTTHYLYAIHLAIVVPLLVVEIPFGKWSHIIYRPLAIYFLAIKEKSTHKQAIEEVTLAHAEQ